MNPELLRALRKLRSGELGSNDKIFKTFSLHETQDALRHGSRAMHVVLARTMDDGFAQVRREIEKSLKNYKGDNAKVVDEKLLEIQHIRAMQAHCR